MKIDAKLLTQLNQLDESLLAEGESEQWDKVAELAKTRQQKLEVLFKQLDLEHQTEEVKVKVSPVLIQLSERINQTNDKLTLMVEKSKMSLGGKLVKLNLNKKAADSYKTIASHSNE